MLEHFGYKAAVAILINTLIALILNRQALKNIENAFVRTNPETQPPPFWVQTAQLGFMILAILSLHHPAFLLGVFLFFLGFVEITRFAQTPLKIKQSLLVGFFLAGLIVLSAEQGWWLQPLLSSMKELGLFVGASALTAVTDNAALTSLASQVADLADSSKYAIVAGAVTGGGLTLIANAPNPAGYSILRPHFKDGLLAGRFLVAAIVPTLIAGACLWLM